LRFGSLFSIKRRGSVHRYTVNRNRLCSHRRSMIHGHYSRPRLCVTRENEKVATRDGDAAKTMDHQNTTLERNKKQRPKPLGASTRASRAAERRACAGGDCARLGCPLAPGSLECSPKAVYTHALVVSVLSFSYPRACQLLNILLSALTSSPVCHALSLHLIRPSSAARPRHSGRHRRTARAAALPRPPC
jgi:hypothetical protein